MERLTERWSDSVVKLKGCSNVYANVERKRAHIQNAIVRLAAYEDSGLMPDEIFPVKHGVWLPVDELEDAFDCSECDAMVQKKYNYCPKCGTKMDLEGEN